MQSQEQIHRMALEATAEAAEKRLHPLVIEKEDLAYIRSGTHPPGKVIPFLGDHCPPDWKTTDRSYAFVDISGFGGPGEAAMTFQEFADWVIPGKGYALVEIGQLQGYVAEYERVLS